MYRVEQVVEYKTSVVCDGCSKTYTIHRGKTPLDSGGREQATLSRGYTFREEGGVFKNYCRACQEVRLNG